MKLDYQADRQYSNRMFTYKSKVCRESPLPEPSNTPLSPRPANKKGKQSKIQHLQKQTLPHKAKHKPNSKSNLESEECKHHNSPMWPSVDTHNKAVSPFSFTTLLQKNAKHHANTSAMEQFSTQKNDCENKKKGDFNKKLNACYPLFTPNTLSTSVQKRSVLQELSCSLNTINALKPANYEKSIGRESKKSPIRLINTNKLNNTPKLKQRKEKQAKQTDMNNSKTFKSVLDSKTVQSLNNSHNININLECSEKIQRFGPESFANKSKKDSCSPYKGKNNLLSTGLVNMTQPPDSNEAATHYRARISKDSPSSKDMPKKTISQQLVNEFKEEEELEDQDIWEAKRRELKQKIGQFQLHYSHKMQGLDAQQFLQRISQQHNPESDHSQLQKQIDCLHSFKQQTLSGISSLLQAINSFSTKIVDNLNQSIRVLEDSCKSSIDWRSLQEEMAQKDRMQLCMCKNQLMLQKLDLRPVWMLKCSSNSQSLQTQKQQIEKAILDIQREVQQQSALIAATPTKMPTNASLSKTAMQQFEVICLNLSALKSKLLETTPLTVR